MHASHHYTGLNSSGGNAHIARLTHRGSPHVHGLAWLQDAPNVEALISEATPVNMAAHVGATTSVASANVGVGSSTDEHAGTVGDAVTGSEASADSMPTAAQREFLDYVDRMVTTVNPAVLTDGSNVADAPLPKTNPHICKQTLLRGCGLP